MEIYDCDCNLNGNKFVCFSFCFKLLIWACDRKMNTCMYQYGCSLKVKFDVVA